MEIPYLGRTRRRSQCSLIERNKSVLLTCLRLAPFSFRASALLLAVFLCAGELASPVGAQDAPAEPLYPKGVAVGPDGSRYVVDRNLPGVWRIKDGVAEVWVRGSERNREPLNAPHCIAIDAEGQVYVGDSAGCNVYRVAPGAAPEPISPERIGVPMALAIDSGGAIYVADIEVHRIVKLTPTAEGTTAETIARVRAPRGLAIDQESRLWIISGYQDPVRRLAADGTVEVIVSGTPLPYPAGIAIDADGQAWVTDSYDRSVSQVTADGKLEAVVQGDPLVYPVGISATADGLIVADSRLPGLWRIVDGVATQEFPTP